MLMRYYFAPHWICHDYFFVNLAAHAGAVALK
jgi:hypothetical protein